MSLVWQYDLKEMIIQTTKILPYHKFGFDEHKPCIKYEASARKFLAEAINYYRLFAYNTKPFACLFLKYDKEQEHCR